jgi:small subunit ribosomal protein S18
MGMRATFSSSSIVRAGTISHSNIDERKDGTKNHTDDAPPARSSATADLLEEIMGSRPRSRFSRPLPYDEAPSFSHSSITLPRSNGKRGNAPGVASAISGLLTESQRIRGRRGEPEPALGTADAVASHSLAQDLSRQITRRWKAGDIYAPKDLSPVEMAKWKNRGKPERDVFDVLQFNPLEHYKVRFLLCCLVLLKRDLGGVYWYKG